MKANDLKFMQSDYESGTFAMSDFDILVYSHILEDFRPEDGFHAYFDEVLGGSMNKMVIIIDRYLQTALCNYMYEPPATSGKVYGKAPLPAVRTRDGDGEKVLCVVYAVLTKAVRPPEQAEVDRLTAELQAANLVA